MDKIQAAIAKARAAREAETAREPIVPKDVAPVPAAAPTLMTGPEAEVRDGLGHLAAWRLMPTFAPPAKHMARQRIVTYGTTGQSTQGAAVFDMLRTKVIQQMRANGWKRLAITSPGADCGKSTVTLNLAFSLSKQNQIHTIVAEMDMRRPSLAKSLGIKGATNFAAVLEGKIDFASVAIRPRPNMAVAVNHVPARNPAELLQSPTIGPALAAIDTQYAPDLMIFDMPPMLVSDDAMAFVGQVDCVLLVAAAGSTSLREIDVCERDLASQTNVLGVVLNKCRYMEKDYGYSAYK